MSDWPSVRSNEEEVEKQRNGVEGDCDEHQAEEVDRPSL